MAYEETTRCPFCAEEILAAARKCKHCGEMLDPTLRPQMQAPAGFAMTPSGRSRIAAALFAFFLGGIGAHKFYLGQMGIGIVYLIFFWTAIPALIGLIEGILLLTMSDEEFARQYG